MEDDDQSSYGPPPDPSLRSWRHPSEIAAEKAGRGQAGASGEPDAESAQIIDFQSNAERGTTRNRPTSRRGWPLAIGAAAILGLCLGGLALASLSSKNRFDDHGPDFDVALDELRPNLSTPEAASSVMHSNTDQVHNLTLPVSTTQPGLASEQSTLTTTTQSRPAPEQEWNRSAYATIQGIPPATVEARSLYSSANGIVPLFAAPNRMPIANGIVVDGLILSSASSLRGFEEVYFPSESGWFSLSLIASDPHHDIAVLQQGDLAAPLSPVVTSPDGPSASAGQFVAVLTGHSTSFRPSNRNAANHNPNSNNPEDGGPDDSDVDDGDLNGGDQPGAAGEVVATNERSTTSDGYEVVGTLLTTCRNDNLVGGAALVDEQGHVVGIVVGSEEKLAAALPLDTAIRIGRSLTQDGWRGGGWLGIEGRTVQGGVQLLDVTQGSPAALAGLRGNDFITRFNDEPLTSFSDLLHSLWLLNPGDLIQVEIARLNVESNKMDSLTLDIELRTRPES